jgi:hypothetical protein
VPVKLIAAIAKFRAKEVAGSSQPKTRLTDASPAAFIQRVTDERRRGDCQELLALMQSVTGDKTGKGCLYLTRLDDVDRKVLRTVVEASVAIMRKQSVAK